MNLREGLGFKSSMRITRALNRASLIAVKPEKRATASRWDRWKLKRAYNRVIDHAAVLGWVAGEDLDRLRYEFRRF